MCVGAEPSFSLKWVFCLLLGSVLEPHKKIIVIVLQFHLCFSFLPSFSFFGKCK